MTAATASILTALIPPGSPPLRVTLALLPAAPDDGLGPDLPPRTTGAGPLGWPEGEPTWEDAAWQ